MNKEVRNILFIFFIIAGGSASILVAIGLSQKEDGNRQNSNNDLLRLLETAEPTVQSQVRVLQQVRAQYCFDNRCWQNFERFEVSPGDVFSKVEEECLNINAPSIRSMDFNEHLGAGTIKVITQGSEYKNSSEFRYRGADGGYRYIRCECTGSTYIVEGKKSAISRLLGADLSE